MFRKSLRVCRRAQYVCSSNYLKLHSSVHPLLYPRFDKDLPNPSFPTPAKLYGPDTDILLNELKKCNSIDRLLELMNMHLNVMNSKHIVSCLLVISDCIKGNEALSKNLMENETFKSFCSRLMKVIRFFDPQEVITTYRIFCSMDVRSNTYVMQSILKMLGTHLNSMNLGQLTFLNFLLHKQRHNRLVDGLRLALPLVLQVQIDQQLDSDKLTEVVNCLQLACRSGLKPSIVQKVVNVILQKSSMLSTSDAVTVIFSLLNIETPIDCYNELMNISFEIVSKNIEEINSRKLITILKTCRVQRYFNFQFCSSLADLIVAQKWDFDLTYWSLSFFYLMGFCPPRLLDHFTEVLCSEAKVYETGINYSPLTCIEFLTALSYHPVKADEAARILYSCEEKLQKLKAKMPYLYVKFYSCLALLGHFPHESLSKMLNEDFLFGAWSFAKKSGKGVEFEQHILSLFWALQLHNEAENFSIPPALLKKVIHSVFQRNLDANYPLEKFIENGLGGAQFLQSGVFTEDGHVIDHIVAMRSGNFPVSLQTLKSEDRKLKSMQPIVFAEDIILPEDAKMIAVIVANECDYFREVEILNGWMDLKVKSLAKKNYGTVLVNYKVWRDLPDREKIPYLMREIKQVLPENKELQSTYS